MQELREILHGRNLHTLKQSVLRAMLIQEANRWILERNPLLATRARVRTQIGDILTVQRLHYSPRSESGALFYLLRSVSELGQLGLLAIGNSREEAEDVFRHTVAVLDREAEAQ